MVLAEVTLSWPGGDAQPAGQAVAFIVHSAPGMLVLEATDPALTLPPLGTQVQVRGEKQRLTGRLAEHGRGGRFLLSLGNRPVRRSLRLRVSLRGSLRSSTLPAAVAVEIVDLTTGGA